MRIFVTGLVVLLAAIWFARYRASQRGERMARERRRAFRQSLLNRRAS